MNRRRITLLICLLFALALRGQTAMAESSHADDFFSGLSQAWDGLRGMASDAGQAASDWAEKSGVAEWAEGAANDISAWADESGVAEWAEGAANDISAWFRASGVTEWAEGASADLQAFIDEHRPNVEAWLAQAGEDVRQAWDTLVNAEQYAAEDVQEAYDTVIEALDAAGQGADGSGNP